MDYKPPKFLFNRHVETIYPSVFRRVNFREPKSERISTPDEDFLDIDWYKQDSPACAIISHGLEGNSRRAYVTGMAKAFFSKGFDVLAWNYRGCSDEINRQLRFYHSGATDDLHTVVTHAARNYKKIILIGFSLGGNLTLKYLGEPTKHSSIIQAITFSVPIDLHQSCLQISKPGNWIYSRRFLKSLKEKVRAKAAIRKDLDASQLDNTKTLFEFDDLYTGPLHGFQGAVDYYTQCSAIHFISSITTPTLVINAKNDPFLSPECYPKTKFSSNKSVQFEFPERGGHVGFSQFGQNGLYWSEVKALSFLEKI